MPEIRLNYKYIRCLYILFALFNLGGEGERESEREGEREAQRERPQHCSAGGARV